MTYFVFGISNWTGCTVRSVVQVLVVGRVVADVDRQNKTPREDPAQGIVHLRRYDISAPSVVTFFINHCEDIINPPINVTKRQLNPGKNAAY